LFFEVSTGGVVVLPLFLSVSIISIFFTEKKSMSQKILTTLLLLTFVIGTSLYSQEPQSDTLSDRVERRMDRERERGRGTGQDLSRMPAGTVTVLGRSFVKSASSGSANIGPFLASVRDQRVRDDLALNQEQVDKIKAIQNEMNGNTLMKTAKFAMKITNADEKTKIEMEKEIIDDIKGFEKRIFAVVTPEQMQKSRTLVFQTLGGLDSPFGNVDTLTALNLTDEQKDKAKSAIDKMQAERLELLEDSLKLAEQAVAAGGPNMSQEDREKFEKEFRFLETRSYESGKKVGDAVRPLLTEEQKTLAIRLMANRPSYLPPLPKRLAAGAQGDEGYRPNDDSWKPGQGAPKGEEDDTIRPERLFPIRPLM
jgi:Ni/Co efflux regulator RcnB